MINAELVKQIVVVVIGFNAGATALKYFLGVIKDKTQSKIDDELYEKVNVVLGYSQKAVDWATANTVHAAAQDVVKEVTANKETEKKV